MASTSDAAQAPAASEKPSRRRSFSREVLLSIFLTAAVALLVCCVIFAAASYTSLNKSATTELAEVAEGLADAIEAEGLSGDELVAFVEEQSIFASSDSMRLTLIDADGTVLYDSTTDDPSTLDNHALRPEVAEAMETGESEAGRYSETLGEDTLYHCILLSSGDVLRVAVTQSSVLGVLAQALLPCLVMLVLVLAFSFLVARRVSKRMAASMESVNLDDPLSSEDAPAELMPLLERLDAQHRRLDAQADERRMFTANVSHELKTPLTVISGYAEIIAQGIAKDEDVRRFAKLIHDEAQNMKAMVNDIIALSRLETADEEKGGLDADMDQVVLLEQVAFDVKERLVPLANEFAVDLSVKVRRVHNEPVRVRGNRMIVDELVRNLAENAVRYNHAGGRARIDVFCDAADGASVVRVVDTGVGIPPELRERVFERFFRVDESRSKETGGSGLGLAIVKHAAQAHGATISIEDNDPVGTIIEVRFPAFEE